MKHAVSTAHLSPELAAIVHELCAELPLQIAANGTPIYAVQGDGLTVTQKEGAIHIVYDARCTFSRAISHLCAVLSDKKEIHEQKRYDTLCYMADVSHAAAMNIRTVKQFIRTLALMGYDSFMLYTEDTFELPGYPYFGYMRGRYTAQELREIDDYAYALGLEVIPCVQTLAHLRTAIRWPDFAGFTDSSNVLLVGDERTYDYIDAVLKQCRACFRSKRIHIGMDEAHELGRGTYLDRNGWRNVFDIMLEHLTRVSAQCKAYGYRPMIWSDMFFRIAFDDAYYVSEGEIPAEVIAKVPPEVELVYWDYYNPNPDIVRHMFHCHKQFQNKIVFAGGVWRWGSPAAFNKFSMHVTKVQLDAAEAHECRDIIVTTWADDNCASSVFSTNASTLYFAERCYAGEIGEAHMDERCRACFSQSFADALAFDLPNDLPGTEISLRPLSGHPYNPSKYLLYNDPLQGLMDLHFYPETAAPTYKKHAERLLALSETDEKFGYALRVLGLLCRTLELKCDFSYRLQNVYRANDRTELARMANEDAPEIITRLEAYMVAYREQWYRENKPFNLNVQEIRIGGLMERMRSVTYAVNAYLRGETNVIEELEAKRLSFGIDLAKYPTPYYYYDGYSRLASVSGV